MNPHYLFAAVAATSISATVISLIGNENTDGLLGMAKILGITLGVVGAVMYATKRYWRDARRLT